MRKIIWLVLVALAFSNSGPVAAQGKKAKKEKTFRADFRDQEIQDFLKAMSAIIGKNIITDDKVRGKITVISPRFIKQSEANNYLTSVLAVKGFGVVDIDKNTIKIVPLQDSVASSDYVHIGRDPIEVEDPHAVITHIAPVYSSKPSRLAGILKRLTGASTQTVDFDESDTLVITGVATEVNRLVKILKVLDPLASEEEVISEADSKSFGSIHIYRLENMQADVMEATLKKLSLPPEGAAAGKTPQANTNTAGKKIDIVAHKESNTLIYVGEESEFNLVRELVRRIDLPRDQVLLEVLIVEVSADDSNKFGLDWRLQKGAAQFNTNLAAEGGSIATSTTDTQNAGDYTGINTLLGFSLGVIQDGGNTALGILNANLSRDNFAVISAPQVLTLDNQEAEINVGEDVAVQSSARISETGTQFNSFEYRPIGVKLKFTPQINKNRMVTLSLYQEVKTIANSNTTTTTPTFNKRDIKTVVRVKDQQTIVIGGLVSSEKNKSINKIPVLGDIPLLGYIFKRTTLTYKKKNLLVFITPHILSNRKIADKVTDKLLNSESENFKERLKNTN